MGIYLSVIPDAVRCTIRGGSFIVVHVFGVPQNIPPSMQGRQTTIVVSAESCKPRIVKMSNELIRSVNPMYVRSAVTVMDAATGRKCSSSGGALALDSGRQLLQVNYDAR